MMRDYDLPIKDAPYDLCVQHLPEDDTKYLGTLEEVLAHLRNWFVVDNGVHAGTFKVHDGDIEGAPFLEGARFYRVCGSLHHDGVYKGGGRFWAPDEEFKGAIWVLAIPERVIELAKEIHVWEARREMPSPYHSESFGGYTYTRATNSSGQEITWKDAFRSRLNRWRKI